MDIRPLFTERDIQGMSKAFNLGKRPGLLLGLQLARWNEPRNVTRKGR